MDDKPDSNLSDPEDDAERRAYTVGGDYNVVGGSVTGGVVGRGSARVGYIAGNDINLGRSTPAEQAREFSELMVKLKDLIVEAHKSGELSEPIARKALTNLSEAAQMVTKGPKPSKRQVVRRLEYVADVLDMAVDLFTANGGIARVLLQASPVVALLIKIASRLF